MADGSGPNMPWRRDLSISYEKVGDVEVAQTNLGGADGSVTAPVRVPYSLRHHPNSAFAFSAA